jgi:iron-regulated transporter 1
LFVNLKNYIIGLGFELFLLRSISNNNESLKKSKEISREANLRGVYVKILIYTSDNTFLASLSAAILYLTVLSFSGSMIGYFKYYAYSDTFIALIRSLAVIMGIASTFVQPAYASYIGNLRAGLHFIWLQALSLIFVVVAFYIPQSEINRTLIIAGISLSRLGLWGFDLSQTQIMQEQVSSDRIGTIFGCQYALSSLFEVAQFVLTLVWYKPSQFYIPTTISFVSVLISAIIFSKYVFNVRGHLFHFKQD